MLAEDLTLLLLDDDSGKAVVESTRFDLALAGAVLVELIERGYAGISGELDDVRPGRVLLRKRGSTGDPVLDQAIERIDERKPAKPVSLLPRLAKGVRTQVLERLADRGVIRFEAGRIIGIFPTKAWPVVDSTHEDELRRRLHEVMAGTRVPTAAEATLVALLQAIGTVPKVLADSGIDRRDLKRKAKEIADGEFTGAAVADAVASVTSAVTAAMVAATSG